MGDAMGVLPETKHTARRRYTDTKMSRLPALETDEPKRRDALTPELRALEKLIGAFAEEFSFAPDSVERLRKGIARVNNAWLLTKARHRHEHHATRAKLNVLTNSQIEKWISASSDPELRAFFKTVWRDEPLEPKKQAAKRWSDAPTEVATASIAVTQLQDTKEKAKTAS
jgi:hypothetical protein